MTTFAVIIPAAGSGSRSGQSVPKQYVEIAGAPVLAHALRAFADIPGRTETVVAIDTERRADAERCAEGLVNVRFVPGGSERQHSIANALAALEHAPDLVLVHDAARPCVPAALVLRVLEAAAQFGAAIPAMPINETVKRVDAGGVIVGTIPRADLRAAQTPQGFRLDLLIRAYAYAAAAGVSATDDASLVEAFGHAVHVVDGETGNIKITLPEDFDRAERWLREAGGYVPGK